MRAQDFAIDTDLHEAAYAGNIGMSEMYRFYQIASDREKSQLKLLIAAGQQEKAWQLLKRVTGVGLKEAESGTDQSREMVKSLSSVGYRMIGSGADATVWAKDSSHVIKILMPEEKTSKAGEVFRKFYEFCQAHPDVKCLPEINEHNSIDILGKEYTQIDMERLLPLKKNSFEEGVVWFLSDYVANGRPWETVNSDLSGRYWEFYNKRKAANLAAQWKNLADQQLADLKQLYEVMLLLYNTGQINKFGWDLHTENAMQREDGTIVITDPWFSLNS